MIVCLIEGLGLSSAGVGARMRGSKLKRSHQKASAQLESVAWRMVEMSSASVLLKRFLLLPVRKRLQLDRKCGGS